jgi:hypothetical protein
MEIYIILAWRHDRKLIQKKKFKDIFGELCEDEEDQTVL